MAAGAVAAVTAAGGGGGAAAAGGLSRSTAGSDALGEYGRLCGQKCVDFARTGPLYGSLHDPPAAERWAEKGALLLHALSPELCKETREETGDCV
eukprot:6182519-Pleurochrysis_carterae.AAC.10